jgi:DNA replication protein DnaC
MDTQDLSRSRALNNIPTRKLQEALAAVNSSADDLQTKNIKLIAINRYAESNIPIEYWTLKMDRDFKGDDRLLKRYNEYIADLKSSYMNGASICFAGGHGLGKTMTTTCILKKASQKGYSCLYTTLSDIVTTLTSASGEDKFLARRELALVDFLVIDEFDNRFFASENSADLYARSLESVFRNRSQNKLPTLMCTNSPNPVDGFNGTLKASIGSLMSGYIKIFTVMPGIDYRPNRLVAATKEGKQ